MISKSVMKQLYQLAVYKLAVLAVVGGSKITSVKLDRPSGLSENIAASVL